MNRSLSSLVLAVLTACPAALAFAGASLSACTCAIAQVQVLPPHSEVHNKSIAHYSTEWWQWAMSFSAPDDPITDPTGSLAGLGQSGPIFFLGGSGTSQRSFTVPRNKYLLIPLLNAELSQLEMPGATPEEVRQATADLADLIDVLYAEVDGVPVPNLFQYREVSEEFKFKAAYNNPIGVPEGRSGAAYANGYYLMLAPLPPGTHVIRFGGGISAFNYYVDTTDTITVEDSGRE